MSGNQRDEGLVMARTRAVRGSSQGPASEYQGEEQDNSCITCESGLEVY